MRFAGISDGMTYGIKSPCVELMGSLRRYASFRRLHKAPLLARHQLSILLMWTGADRTCLDTPRLPFSSSRMNLARKGFLPMFRRD